jgi:hypothetical protein
MRAFLLICTAALALSACGGTDKADLDKLDSKLGGKVNADPTLTAALEDQIMVDPALTQQANEDTIRPTNEPYQAPMPIETAASPAAPPAQTLGSLAAEQAQISKTQFNGCSLDVQYSIDWANRLSPELPLYPQASVSEAAGSDKGACRLRAVTFSAAAAPRAMVDYYLALAKRAGFMAHNSAEGQGNMVSGTRADGAAFYITFQPSGAGTTADLVSNRGS